MKVPGAVLLNRVKLGWGTGVTTGDPGLCMQDIIDSTRLGSEGYDINDTIRYSVRQKATVMEWYMYATGQ